MVNFDKVSQLVEIKKQRTIVGDGELPILRGIERAPLDHESVAEYGRFLKENTRQQRELLNSMTPEEIQAAERQYLSWFRSYLEDEPGVEEGDAP